MCWAVRQLFWHSTADSLIFICKGFTPDKGDWGRRQGTCGMWYHNIRNRSVDTSAPDSGVHDLLDSTLVVKEGGYHGSFKKNSRQNPW